MHKIISLIVLISLLTFFAVKTVHHYNEHSRLKSIKSSNQHRKELWQLLKDSWFFIGTPALMAVIILDGLGYLVHPLFSMNIATEFMHLDSNLVTYVWLIIFIEFSIFGIMSFMRGRKNKKQFVFGDVGALIPRNNKERWIGAMMAASAGINEELFFRLALPLAVLGVVDNQIVAIAVSSLCFGLGHVYQGVKNVALVTFVSLFFFALYALAGNLLIIMLLHFFIDFNHLVIQSYINELGFKSKKNYQT